MAGLSHYNLCKDFSLRQAAYLAAGVDPAGIATSHIAETIHQVLARELEELFMVHSVVSRLNFGDQPDDRLIPIVLDVNHPDRPPFAPTPGEVSRVHDAYRRDPEGLRFDRVRLARWFASGGKGFAPAYAFDLDASSNAVQNPVAAPPLSERERTTYLNIIAGLLELVLSPRAGRTHQSDVIDELLQNYGDKPGIAKSTLEQKFAEAKRRLLQP